MHNKRCIYRVSLTNFYTSVSSSSTGIQKDPKELLNTTVQVRRISVPRQEPQERVGLKNQPRWNEEGSPTMSVKRMNKMKVMWSQSMVNLAIQDPYTATTLTRDITITTPPPQTPPPLPSPPSQQDLLHHDDLGYVTPFLLSNFSYGLFLIHESSN